MKKHLQLLNAIQKHIIDSATRDGVSLADHFPTVQAFKDFVCAATFQTLRDLGHDTEQAINLTFGEGAYDELRMAVDRISL